MLTRKHLLALFHVPLEIVTGTVMTIILGVLATVSVMFITAFKEIGAVAPPLKLPQAA